MARNDRPDFGYSWFWTYGHLIPTAGFTALTLASAALGWPAGVTAVAGLLALWALAGFLVMWRLVRMNEPVALERADFARGGARVLDLGCGAGRTSLTIATARPDAHVVALDDWSADYIEGHGEENTRANLRAGGVDDRVEIQQGDMRAIPFPDESFDAVVSSAAIDHLGRADIALALAEANRVLRPDGQVLFWLIVPNLWTAIAFGPLLFLHGPNATRAEWHRMLGTAGFRIDAEGTSRGVAWIQATRVREPAAATEQAEVRSRTIPRHALVIAGGLVVGGLALQVGGVDSSGLWIAGAGVVLFHLGAAFFGVAALRGWLRRLRERRNAA